MKRKVSPGEEVVQQSRVADPERQRIGAEAGLGTFPKQFITYLEYRQSRVLNGRVSICLCCTGSNFSFRKFGRNFQRKFISPTLFGNVTTSKQSAPHFDVAGLLILQKGDRVALGMVGGCSMVNVFFLELFVGVVQILIDSLVRHRKMTSRNHYLPSNACPPGG